MRVLVQRVRHARVTVEDQTVGAIGPGLVALVGVTHGDGAAEADLLASKLANLRVFDDAAGAMNRSALDLLGDGVPAVAAVGEAADPSPRQKDHLADVDAGAGATPTTPVAVLVVSQFTLYADARKGRRPSFVRAARPAEAAPLVDRLAATLRGLGLPVAEGRFGADMLVELANDGPVTIWLDTDELRR
ncbi:MAG: D-aminoacyl-tRNA deacylase [uncultured Thermomicrobiales bacterium]|uniref:D-aminoacyl-tRNA deacylase n=1 Tax=uncultured Thermomicrobiales bacterium TaxID=1645740 RepID=A0A6J4UP53_9BACT|nr:MAG: D-aminoacyl-tRNA deacylase [uncultured Thermomicrobiales bacterium]